MGTKMKIGQVGVWNFGYYRRDRIRDAGCFEMAAVCDRNPEWLAKAAEQDKAKPYADFAEMLNHPGLEGIVVSTGADSHAPLSIAAMKKGYHVFVEKPLCCSVAEVEELRRVQKETGRIVGLGHNHCATIPLFRLAKQYMDEGRLGTLCAVEENTSHSGGLEIRPGDWRGLADRNPGGMLFQCGCHALHGLNYLFGPVASVSAMMRYDANPNTETADAANVLLRFKSGLVGTLNCYHITGYCHEIRIFGTKGNLYLDTHKNLAWFQPRLRGPEEVREPVPVPAANPADLHANLTSWYNAVRGGPPPYPGLEDGIAAVLPIFAANESARTGKQQEI